ncbi:MAG: molybdopterin-dependent oxidoreductase, partial [Myxococcota bacterium]
MDKNQDFDMPELDRRDFLKLVGVGAGTAVTACADPVEKLVPYVIQPEGVTPGLPSVYASTCTECPASCGLLVTTREGRPIMLQGNPDHPINRGKLCARGQTSLGRTYHPDRYEGPLARAGDGTLQPITWEEGTTRLADRLRGRSGRVYVLGGPVGPSLSGLIGDFASAVGAKRVVYEPFAYEALRSGTEAVFGVRSLPLFDPGKADLIVDMGSDFLASGLSPTENARQYADARDVKDHPHGGSRMISISPRLDLTTQSSDEWIAAGPGSQGAIAFALARAVYDQRGVPEGVDAAMVESFLSGVSLSKAAARADVDTARLQGIVDALLAAKHPLVMPPGVAATNSTATSTAAAAMLLNAMLGAVGHSVHVPPASDAPEPASMAKLEALVADMQAGQVDVLLVHDSNPVYSMPAALGFEAALGRVGTVVSFATLKDETSEASHLVLPDHANMESWGDVAPRPGVRSLIQPTVRPLLDTQATGDTLIEVGRALGGAMPEGSFHKVLENNWSDVNWRDALGRGGVFTDVVIPAVSISGDLSGLADRAPELAGSGDYTLVAFPHPFLGDGRSAVLPWLQEIPDPVTKLQWNSWVEMSFATAEKLDVGFGDVVEVETPAGKVEASVFPRGGIRDDTIAIPTGQGHSVGFYASMAGEGERPGWLSVESPEGEEGAPRGVNVISLLSSSADEKGGRTW